MKAADWDRHADDFEELVTDVAQEEAGGQLDRYVAAARPSARASVLVDLGCGVGSFIRKYGERFRSIHAIEFAPRIIARARERCAGMGITWHTMDGARAARTIGAAADLTVCLNVITAPNAAKRDALWANVAQVTKPGGRALIVVPSIESYRMVEAVEQSLGQFLQPPSRPDGMAMRDDAWQKHYARGELVALLPALGLELQRIGKALYPWSQEGLDAPRSHGAKKPWDWICLARRVA